MRPMAVPRALALVTAAWAWIATVSAESEEMEQLCPNTKKHGFIDISGIAPPDTLRSPERPINEQGLARKLTLEFASLTRGRFKGEWKNGWLEPKEKVDRRKYILKVGPFRKNATCCPLRRVWFAPSAHLTPARRPPMGDMRLTFDCGLEARNEVSGAAACGHKVQEGENYISLMREKESIIEIIVPFEYMGYKALAGSEAKSKQAVEPRPVPMPAAPGVPAPSPRPAPTPAAKKGASAEGAERASKGPNATTSRKLRTGDAPKAGEAEEAEKPMLTPLQIADWCIKMRKRCAETTNGRPDHHCAKKELDHWCSIYDFASEDYRRFADHLPAWFGDTARNRHLKLRMLTGEAVLYYVPGETCDNKELYVVPPIRIPQGVPEFLKLKEFFMEVIGPQPHPGTSKKPAEIESTFVLFKERCFHIDPYDILMLALEAIPCFAVLGFGYVLMIVTVTNSVAPTKLKNCIRTVTFPVAVLHSIVQFIPWTMIWLGPKDQCSKGLPWHCHLFYVACFVISLPELTRTQDARLEWEHARDPIFGTKNSVALFYLFGSTCATAFDRYIDACVCVIAISCGSNPQLAQIMIIIHFFSMFCSWAVAFRSGYQYGCMMGFKQTGLVFGGLSTELFAMGAHGQGGLIMTEAMGVVRVISGNIPMAIAQIDFMISEPSPTVAVAILMSAALTGKQVLSGVKLVLGGPKYSAVSG